MRNELLANSGNYMLIKVALTIISGSSPLNTIEYK